MSPLHPQVPPMPIKVEPLLYSICDYQFPNNPTCRKCGTEEETSVHILCECEVLASLKHTYLGSCFLDPEDIRVLGVRAIWNFVKVTGLL